ncbi:hypothetical protein GCM10011506_30740 [Marivirga lumbricoides]|uniref:Putative auto-transporter adhesin head GIN domain-containing protein n=3 Tax=Marivirga lumbricoides TaxID=1046115 RepID=A0ABQ1MLY6_9BACT|nr:hypothetical protein GCM10011506_30740 [Marivirga lumbricoides]
MAQQRETRSLDSFTEVSSSASIKVTLVQGSSPKVDVSTDGELEDVLTEVSGNHLKISRKQNDSFFGSNYNNDKIEVTVYFQEIDRLKVSSSSKMEVKNLIKGKRLNAEVSSSGKLTFSADVEESDISVSSSGRLEAQINCKELEAKVSSSGKIEINGEADEFDATASSSGTINGDGFTCSIADLSTSSSGKISLTVASELSGKASSSGRISYKGSPKIVSVNTSSGGKINSKD